MFSSDSQSIVHAEDVLKSFWRAVAVAGGVVAVVSVMVRLLADW